MYLNLRTWLLAITVLLLAEDFQYLLRIEPLPGVQIENTCENGCDDREEEENKGEKEEESKKEGKEDDDNKNRAAEQLSRNCSRLAKNKFHDALYLLSDVTRELESPPPERL